MGFAVNPEFVLSLEFAFNIESTGKHKVEKNFGLNVKKPSLSFAPFCHVYGVSSIVIQFGIPQPKPGSAPFHNGRIGRCRFILKQKHTKYVISIS